MWTGYICQISNWWSPNIQQHFMHIHPSSYPAACHDPPKIEVSAMRQIDACILGRSSHCKDEITRNTKKKILHFESRCRNLNALTFVYTSAWSNIFMHVEGRFIKRIHTLIWRESKHDLLHRILSTSNTWNTLLSVYEEERHQYQKVPVIYPWYIWDVLKNLVIIADHVSPMVMLGDLGYSSWHLKPDTIQENQRNIWGFL